MAAAIYSTSNQEGIDINSVFVLDTGTPEYPRPPFNPGTVAIGTDGSEWVYCTASITIAATSVVVVSAGPGSWSVALIGGATVSTPPTGQLVGIVGGSTGTMAVPAPTGTQTGAFFWVQRAGNVPNVKCAASTTKNTLLHSSATVAGQVTASGGGSGTTYQINNLVTSQADGSVAGPNTAIANFPSIGVTN